MRNTLICLLLGCVCVACGGRRIRLDDQPVVTHPGVLEVSAEWVKDKRVKFDILFTIRNLGEDALLIKRRDITCARGGTSGELDMRDDPVFDLGPNAAETFLGKCRTGNVPGPFVLQIAEVFVDGSDEARVVDFVWAVDRFGGLDDMASQGTAPGGVALKTEPRRAKRKRRRAQPPPPPPAPAPKPAAPASDHSLEAGASEMANKRYLIGRELYLQGNLEGAAAEFQSAFDIAPQSARLAFNLARCHERMGHTREAIQFYEQYLHLAPPGANDRVDIERLVAAMKKRAK